MDENQNFISWLRKRKRGRSIEIICADSAAPHSRSRLVEATAICPPTNSSLRSHETGIALLTELCFSECHAISHAGFGVDSSVAAVRAGFALENVFVFLSDGNFQYRVFKAPFVDFCASSFAADGVVVVASTIGTGSWVKVSPPFWPSIVATGNHAAELSSQVVHRHDVIMKYLATTDVVDVASAAEIQLPVDDLLGEVV